MKLKLLVSYVGTEYSGWQIQENKQNVPTIQGELEKAFYRILKEDIRVIGASRTDAGVHADEQCAHCSISYIPQKIHWQRALNTALPYDIRVKYCDVVDENFHSHLDSIGKIYTYTLWTDKNYIPPRLHPFSWSCGTLDYKKIEEILPLFIGTHDFASFQNTGTAVDNTIRHLKNIEIQHISDSQTDFIFYGNGFLKQMIRNIMGLFVDIGQNRLDKEQIESIFEAKNRTSIFPTAPARGLTLNKVIYAKD